MMRAIGISDADELSEQIPADHLAAKPIASTSVSAPRRDCAGTYGGYSIATTVAPRT
jgi:hypothetical protein